MIYKNEVIVAGIDSFRQCSKCNKMVPISDFYRERDYECKNCNRTISRAKYRSSRVVLLKNYDASDLFVTGENVYKECTSCSVVKDIQSFGRKQSVRNGVSSDCKECVNYKRMEYYWTNLEQEQARRKAYQATLDKSVLAAQRRQWASENPDSVRNTQLKHDYGITLEDAKNLILGQGDICPICKEGFHNENSWVIDHCHATGKVRGAIHGSCNTMLGFAKDRIDVLQNAVSYLEASRVQ